MTLSFLHHKLHQLQDKKLSKVDLHYNFHFTYSPWLNTRRSALDWLYVSLCYYYYCCIRDIERVNEKKRKWKQNSGEVEKSTFHFNFVLRVAPIIAPSRRELWNYCRFTFIFIFIITRSYFLFFSSQTYTTNLWTCAHKLSGNFF